MSLDPQVAEILALVKRANRPQFWEMTPQEARETYRKAAKVLEIPAARLHRIDDFTIKTRDGYDLPLRLYLPRPRQTGEAMPLMLYCHGGGFTIGSIATHDNVCRMFAQQADCQVISVDYRLAPEYKFPVALDDTWDALSWVRNNARALGTDPRRIALAGDSAGGTLMAVTAIQARDHALLTGEDWSPVLQLLIYPGTGSSPDTSSHQNFADGFMLDAKTIKWFFGNYLRGPDDASDWRFAPLNGLNEQGQPVSLNDVAPACIVVAGYDPLHDEGMAYAERLRAAGVSVQLLDYPGMVHGFFNYGGYVEQARQAHQAAVKALLREF